MRARTLTLLLLASACGPKAAPADAPTSPVAAVPATAAPADDLPVAPMKTPPPDVSAAEKSELSGTCAPLLTAMIEGEAAAIRSLDDAFRDGKSDADDAALAVAMERAKRSSEGLAPSEHQRCLALFETQARRKLFDHEPAESEARAVVDSCVKRVEAVYGKQSMAFDEGAPQVRQGPFCPDDFPVPAKLTDLPYQSKKDDWDTPAFRCLQFGLRAKQYVQFEYASPLGSGEFTCIGRFRPRQGGAPVEVVRGGKQGPGGELLLQPKISVRRMTPKR
jgi:hypothetical protein